MEENTGTRPELTFWQRWTYSAGNFGCWVLPPIVSGWVVYFYTSEAGGLPAFMPTLALGAFVIRPDLVASVAMFFGKVVDSLANPFVGYFSDHVGTRWGRRIPMVRAVSLPMCVVFALMWFPPSSSPAISNFVFLFVLQGLFWFLYTSMSVPYISLLPEVVESNEERVRISVIQGVFQIVAMITAPLAAGMLVDAYMPQKGGFALAGVALPDGFKPMGILVGLLACVSFYVGVMLVRERPSRRADDAPPAIVSTWIHCLKNKSFLAYAVGVSFYLMAFDLINMATPFIFRFAAGGTEEHAGYAMAGVLVVAVFAFPLASWITLRLGKRTFLIASGLAFGVIMGLVPVVLLLPFGTPAMKPWFLIGLYALMGLPASGLVILPRLVVSDIIDDDEQRTGERREALYFGMEGLLTKFASGLSFVVWGALAYLGRTETQQLGLLVAGPVTGLIAICGGLVTTRYPIRK